ncbi:hypothetical protein HK405_015225, partial [Cladochytrium tenue]
ATSATNASSSAIASLINSDPSVSNTRTSSSAPSHLSAQLLGLFGTAAICAVVVFMIRRKQLADRRATTAAGAGSSTSGSAPAKSADQPPPAVEASAGAPEVAAATGAASSRAAPASRVRAVSLGKNGSRYEQLVDEDDDEDGGAHVRAEGPDDGGDGEGGVRDAPGQQGPVGGALAGANTESSLALEMAQVDRSERANFV